MSRDDIIRKLTSRKFWTMIVGLLGTVGLFVGLPEGNVKNIGCIIMGLGSIVAYIFGESWVDAARLAMKHAPASDTVDDA